MRLPLQIALGQAFVVVFPIGLSMLGISLLLELTGTVDRIAAENYSATQSAQEVHNAMLRYEIAHRDGASELREAEKAHFSEAVKALRGVVSDERESQLVDQIEEDGVEFFEGQRPLEEMVEVVTSLVDLQEDAILKGSRRCRQAGQSGIGLIAVLGALGLFTALYFGYWLTRNVGYPLERLARGLEDLAAGNLQRRFDPPTPSAVVARLASAANRVADSLLTVHSDRRLDFLLVAAAVETILDEGGAPAGLLSPGRRLVVANERARELLRTEGASLEEIAAAREKDRPGSVARTELLDAGGRHLGELVRLRPQGE